MWPRTTSFRRGLSPVPPVWQEGRSWRLLAHPRGAYQFVPPQGNGRGPGVDVYHTRPLIHPSDGQNRTRSRSPYCLHGWACSVPAAARSVDAPACVYHLLYLSCSFVCVCYSCVCVVYYHLNHQYHHLLSHPGLFVVCVVFSFYVFVLHYLLVLLAVQRMMLLVVCYVFLCLCVHPHYLCNHCHYRLSPFLLYALLHYCLLGAYFQSSVRPWGHSQCVSQPSRFSCCIPCLLIWPR